MNDDPNALLPSLEAEPLLASTLGWQPSEKKRLAAIQVAVDVLRRESWSREVELAGPLFDRYATAMPLEGADARFVETSYKFVDTEKPTTKVRCTACAIFRGKELCVHCGGRAASALEPPCVYCEQGYIVCRICDGSGTAVRATLRLVNDRHLAIRRVIVPTLPGSLATAVEIIVDAQREPRAEFRFDLQANVVESAYRGASAVREPEFRGHAFGDALPRALLVLKDVARYRDAVKTDVRAYAWPFLLLTNAEHAAVLVKDASGNSHLV